MFDPLTSTMMVLFAILNATVPGQTIPIEVTPTLVDESGQATNAGGSTPVIDAALIGSIVTIGSGLFYAWKKGQSRDNATADSVVNLSESLKGTDVGSKDTASILAQALSQLQKNEQIAPLLQNCAPAAKKNADEWNQDVKQYYENKPVAPRAGELENDKVKTKLAQVNQITEKTDDP